MSIPIYKSHFYYIYNSMLPPSISLTGLERRALAIAYVKIRLLQGKKNGMNLTHTTLSPYGNIALLSELLGSIQKNNPDNFPLSLPDPSYIWINA